MILSRTRFFCAIVSSNLNDSLSSPMFTLLVRLNFVFLYVKIQLFTSTSTLMFSKIFFKLFLNFIRIKQPECSASETPLCMFLGWLLESYYEVTSVRVLLCYVFLRNHFPKFRKRFLAKLYQSPRQLSMSINGNLTQNLSELNRMVLFKKS